MRNSLATLGLVLCLGGLLTAAFAPGGWLNNREKNSARLDTPLGSIGVSAETTKTSNWPRLGYGLLIAGGVCLVVGLAVKPSPR
jgi:hypothetical protein